MLSYGLLICGAYLSVVLETALAPAWTIGSAAPDLLALTALIWTAVGGRPRAYLGAAALGLLADLNATGRLGVSMASFALVAYCLASAQPQLARLPVWLKAAALAPAIAAQALAIGLIRKILGEIDMGLATMALRCLAVGAYTAAISLPPLMVSEWVRKPRWS
jgi:rod shape-determining protein MreD